MPVNNLWRDWLPFVLLQEVTRLPGRWWWGWPLAAGSTSPLWATMLSHQNKEPALTLLARRVDGGQAINPAIDIANIEAAFTQGYGWIAMENTLFSPEGKLLTRGHSEYNMPSVADCPSKFNVTLLKSEIRQH